MDYRIHFACVSHIGKVRCVNQDNFICDGYFMQPCDDKTQFPLMGTKTSKEPSLFGIFDGMGGEECGEIAAYLAARNAAQLQIREDTIQLLEQFCQKANEDICAYGQENEVSSMGTTAAMLAFTENGITLCNIGDTKIFRYSDQQLKQISEDHVSVAAFGVKPPLSQNLGIPPTEMLIAPYLARGNYHDGDRYLICSDGLTDMVCREEISEILEGNSIEDCTRLLLEKALANGGWDNTTIVLLEIEKNRSKLFRFFNKIWGGE